MTFCWDPAWSSEMMESRFSAVTSKANVRLVDPKREGVGAAKRSSY